MQASVLIHTLYVCKCVHVTAVALAIVNTVHVFLANVHDARKKRIRCARMTKKKKSI